jgi:glycosyltransferase involved in cell wall biosynthesis
MSFSVIVSCPQSSLLVARHLLHSLKQQQIAELEVVIYYEQGVTLPEWLPDHWRTQAVPPQTPLSQIWNQGLAAVTGEWVTFAEPEVFYHPLHFAILAQSRLESDTEGLYVQCQFLDRELYPLAIQSASLQSKTFKSSVIPADLLTPMGAFAFKRSSLAADCWSSEFSYYLEEEFLGRWTESHQLQEIPTTSVSAIPQRNRTTHPFARAEEFTRLYRHWLATHAPEALTPPSAFPANSQTPSQALQYILQGLYNRGLQAEASAFSEKYAAELSAAFQNRTLWFIPDKTALSPLLQETLRHSVAQGECPVLITCHLSKRADTQPLEISYAYQAGLIEITLSHLSKQEQDQAFRHFSPEILKHIKLLIEQTVPTRAHFTSFRLFSLHMTQYLTELNIPVYYSFSDPADLQLRQWLQEPETEAHWLQIRKSEAENLNLILQKFFEQQAARIFVETPAALRQLENSGLQTARVTRIETASAIQEAHLHPLPCQTPKTQLPSLGLMHQLLTGKKLPEQVVADNIYFEGCRQVLTLGAEEKELLRHLHHQNIPALGLSETPDEDAHDLKNLLFEGSPLSLGTHLKAFDGLHTAYTLEQLTPRQLIQFLKNCNLALYQGGRLVLRLLNPDTLQPSGFHFWLEEKHQRPYAADLIVTLLKHCGFEVLEQRVTTTPWKDILIDSVLRFPFLPASQFPVLTRRLSEFWQQHQPDLKPAADSRVLIAGPHIQPLWTQLRSECQNLTGLSFSLSEITAKHKPESTQQLHHTKDFVRSLQQLTPGWDLMLWQGVLETLTPIEVQQALHISAEKLTDTGQLWMQTLDYSEAPELFWEGLLNRRPYPKPESLFRQAGFTVVTSTVTDGVRTWLCQKQNDLREMALLPHPAEIPFHAQKWLDTHTNDWHPQTLADLEVQPTDSQEFLCLGGLLQTLSPAEMEQALRATLRILNTCGTVLLWFNKPSEESWDQPEISRPYARFTIDKRLKEMGLKIDRTEETDSHCFWIVRKLMQYPISPSVRQALSIFWQGDFFNYHSLSLVNRHLAEALYRRGHINLQAVPFSNANFMPEPGEPFYLLRTHLQRPLLSKPDIVLRHHWPPDFEPPAQPGHWVMIQPWEFGSIPERWIFNMNKYVDQVWVPSQFVKDCYLESGLAPNKIKVVPNGVDTAVYHPEAPPFLLPTTKKFRFLFIGGGILRKGVDLLIQAFIETFTRTDDVCLVLKEFGTGTVYEGLNIAERLLNYRAEYPDMPEILHLTDELPQAEMPSLYTACDCLVHPYRGEGFGLPIAEAMSAQRPVIVTGFGAALDFCNADNAYLIPAEKQFFGERQIDRVLATVDYPFWAEPDFESLKLLMRHVWENRKEAARKGVMARETIVNHFSWEHAAEIAETYLQELIQTPVFRFNRSQILGNHLGEGFQAFQRSDYSVAIEKFEYALRIDPYQPDVAYNLGLAHMMDQNYEQALKYLSQSLREGECTADLCYAMGTTLRHLGDHQTAEEFHHKARELEALLTEV